ncbi:MAG TPA: SDR family NAD(P)-dependent oxidoreductase [Ramlibacter sp.]|jgi:short-subunit dehydrogenase
MHPRRAFRSIVLVLFAMLAACQLAGCATSIQADDAARVAGKTYVVTGASSGFGRGIALKLGSLRANVVLAARRTELLQEVAAQVTAAGGTALVVTTDVAKPEEMRRLADSAVARFGRVDVWINNAGVGAIGRFEDIPVEDHSRLVDVNLKGVIYGSHAALRLFRAQGHGALINMGSVDSEVPHAYQASYSATKAGVLSLGRVLNEELRLGGHRAISVSTVLPWAADTPFWEHAATYSGSTPRFAAMDDPQIVVDAVVWVSLHPREELPVGGKAAAAYTSHRIFSNLTERITGNIAHRYQMDSASPRPSTPGALHQPMQSGRGVEGGVRERMRQEDAVRGRP